MEQLEKAKEILKKYHQEHIIGLLDTLEKDSKQELINQILNSNIKQIIDLYKNRNIKPKNDIIEPIDFIDKEKLTITEKQELYNIGKKIIENNQYAVVTMAGGQGTRLGCNGPKGSYKIDIGDKGKYIFEILIDTLKRAKETYGTEVYWYIMTSEENNKKTIEFLQENNYFGYSKEKIKFFIQDKLPLIDLEGKLLIDESNKIKTASNGNGSVYMSLKKSGMIEDMEKNNIKWVYICGVDNIMVNMVDPTLLGLAIKNNVSVASKSVKKSYPEEKVGLFCKKNGKPSIIEYIDMTEEMINKRNEKGELLYSESNIVSHLFRIEELKKIATHELEYHCAIKNNICKFETFIFDGLKYSNNMLIMRVKREDEFAPIKNKQGVDTPETAKKIYEDYWKGKK